VRVIDIGPLFTTDDGGILFADKDGNQVYQDSGHLSASGAGLVKASLLNLMANAPRVASTAPDEHPDRQ
jgi:hypothetical protein